MIGDAQADHKTLDQGSRRHDEYDRPEAQQSKEEIDRLFDQKADPEHDHQQNRYCQSDGLSGHIAGKADLPDLGEQPEKAAGLQKTSIRP